MYECFGHPGRRLDRICDALGKSVTELIQSGESASLTELGEQQEQALAADSRALVITIGAPLPFFQAIFQD
jgi:hypothetical protein